MVLCYLNAFNTCLLILLFIYINAVSLIASDKLNSYSLQVRPAKQYLNALRSHIFCCDFFVAFIVTHVVTKLDNTFTTAITVHASQKLVLFIWQRRLKWTNTRLKSIFQVSSKNV